MGKTVKKQAMKVTDMTVGNPLRLIFVFAIPLFIGNLFQQVYSIVDTMVAGYSLGDSAIAAIGATASLYMLLIDFASGMNIGFSIIVSQRFGAHDEKKLKESIAGMIVLDVSFSILLTVSALVFMKPLMHFMNTPDAIFAEAYRYIFVICLGLTVTVCYNMFASILRALGNSHTSLYFLIISSVLNIGLDLLFVVGLKTGVAGAALATVVAQAVSATLCGIYLFRNYQSVLPGREDFRVSREMFLELFLQGFAMGLSMGVVNIGSVLYQRANNGLGEIFISAHMASRRIMNILLEPMDCMITGLSIFVGQNWGAGEKGRIRFALKWVLGLETLWGLLCFAFIFLFGRMIVFGMTGTASDGILDNAVLSLRWHLGFFPMLGGLIAMRASMESMGKKIVPMISSVIELCMKVFSAAWLIPQLGFLGTCITEPITWTLMVLFLAGMFFVQKEI